MPWRELLHAGSITTVLAVILVPMVFLCLALRYACAPRPFDLKCGPFQLRAGEPTPPAAKHDPSDDLASAEQAPPPPPQPPAPERISRDQPTGVGDP